MPPIRHYAYSSRPENISGYCYFVSSRRRLRDEGCLRARVFIFAFGGVKAPHFAHADDDAGALSQPVDCRAA